MISGQRNISDEFEVLSIDNVDQVRIPFGILAATFHVVVLVNGIEHRAIDARRKFNLVNDAVVLATHEFNRSEIVIPVRHNKIIGLGQKKNRMGASKPGDALQAFTSHKVKNFDGLVVLGREE